MPCEQQPVETVTLASVLDAAAHLDGIIRRTPVLHVDAGAEWPVALKLENAQLSGSFKIRGAVNAILSHRDGRDTVVAASGGNHGIAVAQACRLLRLRAEIFVPVSTGPEKIRLIQSLDARVRVIDATFTEVEAEARAFATEHEALFVHPFDDPDVIAGQGTVAIELVEQVPGISRIYVAVGGGGLAAGIVAALEGRVPVVAVEPVLSPSLGRAVAAGRPVPAPTGGVAADALGAPMIGGLAFSLLEHGVERVVEVSEDEILRAQAMLWELCRMAVEPAAACAFAGYLREAGTAGPAAVIVCGGNVDPLSLGGAS